MQNALHAIFQRELINWCRRQNLPMGLTPEKLLELEGLTPYQKTHLKVYMQTWGEAEARANLLSAFESIAEDTREAS